MKNTDNRSKTIINFESNNNTNNINNKTNASENWYLAVMLLTWKSARGCMIMKKWKPEWHTSKIQVSQRKYVKSLIRDNVETLAVFEENVV